MPPKRITVEERNRRAAAAAVAATAAAVPARARGTGRAAAPNEPAFVSREEFTRAFSGMEAMLQQLLDKDAPPAAPAPIREEEDHFLDFADLDAANGPPGTAPFRGTHGECPSVEERFAFLDEKVLTAAMAGRLSPETTES